MLTCMRQLCIRMHIPSSVHQGCNIANSREYLVKTQLEDETFCSRPSTPRNRNEAGSWAQMLNS